MPVIEHFWSRLRPAHLILFPLSLLFGAVVTVRRFLFGAKLLPSTRLPVPVIVVGNISVGGTGKTPLVLWLVRWLQSRGMRPGIVSRGYGGTGASQRVTPSTDAALAGDEPVLLASSAGCPVWIGRRRVEAGRNLLAENPEVDVLISDDGLQHYALARDMEIAVVDGERRFGNGLLLPAGPLREPTARLTEVDAVVINGGPMLGKLRAKQFTMTLLGRDLVNVRDPHVSMRPDAFAGKTVFAVAGIGNPDRFFRHLRELGMHVRPQPFPDHYAFSADDLAFAGDEPVVMTQKDAVKCRAFAGDNFWYLPVEAQVEPALGQCILAMLESHHGRQAP